MKEKLQNTQKDKFLDDFVVRVQGYLNKYPLNFKLENTDINLELLLHKEHLLSILLFNKQKFINNYLENINEEYNSLLYAILIFEEHDSSCIGVKVRMEENISSNPEFSSVYSKLLLDLAKEVLDQGDFYIENDAILLDTIFDNFNNGLGTIFKIEEKRSSKPEDTDFIQNITIEIADSDTIDNPETFVLVDLENQILSEKVNKLKELVDLKENLESVNQKYLSNSHSVLIKQEIFDKLDLDILSLSEEINNM